MASPHRAIPQSEHGVKMKAGLAIVSLRHISRQAEDLALLADGDRLVGLCREVEPADLGFGEGADCQNRGSANASRIGEFGDRLEGLFVLIQNKHKGPLCAAGDGFRFHEMLPKKSG
jgi:hypothetical protein